MGCPPIIITRIIWHPFCSHQLTRSPSKRLPGIWPFSMLRFSVCSLLYCLAYEMDQCETMTASADTKNDKRSDCKIPIVVSPFNSKDFKDALLVDHSLNGITFLSKDAFFPGTAIVIRVTDGPTNDSCKRDYSKLPGNRIGEVKWCTKHAGEASTAYEVGVRYYYHAY